MSTVKYIKLFVLTGGFFLAGLLTFSFISPVSPLADSVSHFRIHIAVPLIAFSILILYFRFWKRGFIFLGVAAASLLLIDHSVGNGRDSRNMSGGTEFTVAQLNLYFGNQSPEKVIDFFRKSKPDLVILQEVSKSNRMVIEQLENELPYRIECPYAAVGAVAVLSRFPKAEGDSGTCVSRMGLTWIRVLIGDQPTSIASIHLHWPYPFEQYEQIQSLNKYFSSIPHPMILAGDFNAAPWSHAAYMVSNATNTEVAGGVRFTLRKSIFGGLLPLKLPIDHILTSKEIMPKEIHTGEPVGSDHLPVVSKLVLYKLR